MSFFWMRGFLMENIWLVTLLWVLIYLSDYYLTIYFARLYRDHLKDYLRFEGSLELTPQFQKDVDALRIFSPNFLWRLLLSAVIFPAVWWLSAWVLGLPEFFFVLVGALFLREAAVHLRHFRNLALALLSRQPGSLSGQVTYSRWLNLKVSAVELWSFSFLFLLIGIVMESWFFLGGAFSCLITGWQHWAMTSKPKPALQPVAPAE